ncbi:MAG TPA: N-acetylmuramoyl-L-alanine amidase [Stellaceae bacterium]|nr:N-acetylmuramoyl-L-alanine amidase [Stellaceae bacterium]
MHILERSSPNHGPRPAGAVIDMLILHYTGMRGAAEAIERLCDPEAQVSAHYLIDEDGTVWRLVAEERRAWHAGVSSWRGRSDINDRSIGIELVNPGHDWGYRDFPEAQITALEALCRDILARHPIPPHLVLGHSDVAPQRKSDPGELFDWHRLARSGIGFWPGDAARAAAPQSPAELQRLLAAVGYETPQSGALDDETRQVLIAFQRHFRPARCDGEADGETRAQLAAVAQGI